MFIVVPLANLLTPQKMNKVFLYLFAAFGIVAAVAVALGAYWHIYTLGGCVLLVWCIKSEMKTDKNK